MKIQEQQVSVTIKNTGAIAGAEVVQLYIAPPEEGIFRPKKELKGFARVELQLGEAKTVCFTWMREALPSGIKGGGFRKVTMW